MESNTLTELSEEVRTVSSTGAEKGVKPEAFDLIPFKSLQQLALFYGTATVDFTAASSWREPLNYAIDRLVQFWSEPTTIDPSTGLHYCAGVMAAVFHVIDSGNELAVGDTYIEPCGVLDVREGVLSEIPRYDLIPVQPLRLLARHYGAGSEKYAAHNWAGGYEWSKSFAALNRHLWAAIDGEPVDEELGSLHLIAVAWHCCSLIEFASTHPGFDDRPVRGERRKRNSTET